MAEPRSEDLTLTPNEYSLVLGPHPLILVRGVVR